MGFKKLLKKGEKFCKKIYKKSAEFCVYGLAGRQFYQADKQIHNIKNEEKSLVNQLTVQKQEAIRETYLDIQKGVSQVRVHVNQSHTNFLKQMKLVEAAILDLKEGQDNNLKTILSLGEHSSAYQAFLYAIENIPFYYAFQHYQAHKNPAPLIALIQSNMPVFEKSEHFRWFEAFLSNKAVSKSDKAVTSALHTRLIKEAFRAIDEHDYPVFEGILALDKELLEPLTEIAKSQKRLNVLTYLMDPEVAQKRALKEKAPLSKDQELDKPETDTTDEAMIDEILNSEEKLPPAYQALIFEDIEGKRAYFPLKETISASIAKLKTLKPINIPLTFYPNNLEHPYAGQSDAQFANIEWPEGVSIPPSWLLGQLLNLGTIEIQYHYLPNQQLAFNIIFSYFDETTDNQSMKVVLAHDIPELAVDSKPIGLALSNLTPQDGKLPSIQTQLVSIEYPAEKYINQLSKKIDQAFHADENTFTHLRQVELSDENDSINLEDFTSDALSLREKQHLLSDSYHQASLTLLQSFKVAGLEHIHNFSQENQTIALKNYKAATIAIDKASADHLKLIHEEVRTNRRHIKQGIFKNLIIMTLSVASGNYAGVLFNTSNIALSMSAINTSIVGVAVRSAVSSVTKSLLSGKIKRAAEYLLKDVTISCAAEFAGITLGNGKPIADIPVGSIAAIRAEAARAVVLGMVHNLKGEKPYLSLAITLVGSIISSKLIQPKDNIPAALKAGATTALTVGLSALVNHSDMDEAFTAATHSMLAHLAAEQAQKAAVNTRHAILKHEFDVSPIRQQMKVSLSRLIEQNELDELAVEQAVEITLKQLEEHYNGDFKSVLTGVGQDFIEHCVSLAIQSGDYYGNEVAIRETVTQELIDSMLASGGDLTKMYEHLKGTKCYKLQPTALPLAAPAVIGGMTAATILGSMILQERIYGELYQKQHSLSPSNSSHVLANSAIAYLYFKSPIQFSHGIATNHMDDSTKSQQTELMTDIDNNNGVLAQIKSFFKPLIDYFIPDPYIFEHYGPDTGYSTANGESPEAARETRLTTPIWEATKDEGVYAGGEEITPHRNIPLPFPKEDNINNIFIMYKSVEDKPQTYTPGKSSGGSSTVLGKNINEAMGWSKNQTWKGYQAQHLIPCQLKNHPVLEKIGINLDEANNGIFLPDPKSRPLNEDNVSLRPRHRGAHPKYTSAVKEELDMLDINMPISELQKSVFELQLNLRKLHLSGLPVRNVDNLCLNKSLENSLSSLKSSNLKDIWKKNLDKLSSDGLKFKGQVKSKAN